MTRAGIARATRLSAQLAAYLLFVCMPAAGCSEKIKTVPATAVVVSVYSKDVDIASLRTTILDANSTKSGPSASYPIGPDKGMFPFSFTVVPGAGSNGGRFVVRVEGLDDSEAVRVSVQAQASFLPGKTRLLTLWLAKICEDVVCEEDQTCHYEDGDSKAGQCGDILTPKLTDYTLGADEDLGQFPSLAAPDPESPTDAGSSAIIPEAGLTPDDAGVDASPPPQAANLPTVGNFRSLGARRSNSDGTMILYDDGFEESGRVCNPDGMCAVAGFVP